MAKKKKVVKKAAKKSTAKKVAKKSSPKKLTKKASSKPAKKSSAKAKTVAKGKKKAQAKVGAKKTVASAKSAKKSTSAKAKAKAKAKVPELKKPAKASKGTAAKKTEGLAGLAKKIVAQAKDKLMASTKKEAEGKKASKATKDKKTRSAQARELERAKVTEAAKPVKSSKKPIADEEDFDAGDDFFDMDYESEEAEGSVDQEGPRERRLSDGDEQEEEVILTDAEGRRYCRVRDCDQVAVVEGYCRYHYLMFWKRIQVRKKILTEGKLARYIEDLTARYPDKYLEMLKKDLRNEKDFLAAIQELEIDESSEDSDYEDEAQNYIEEVRGMSESSSREDEDY